MIEDYKYIVILIALLVLGLLSSVDSEATIIKGVTKEQVCVTGYSAKIRPPVDYTNKIKRRMLSKSQSMHDYVLDHIDAIQNGGEPANPNNFMIQTIAQGHEKDKFENKLHKDICSGKITIEEAHRLTIRFWRVNK